jgi:hypothetical protein
MAHQVGSQAVNAFLEDDVVIDVEGLPAALGQTTKANSMPVTLASDQGNLPVQQAEKTLLTACSTGASSGDNTAIAAPGLGVKIVVVSLMLQGLSTTATTIKLLNGTGGTVINQVLAQNQGDGLLIVYPMDARPKLSTNTAAIVNLSGANSCGWNISYYTE